MINKGNKTFITRDCRREWRDNNKNGKTKSKNQINNSKSDCIIKRFC